MAADQIAEISPMVREVFESDSDGMCATFEITGNPDAWAQVMKGTINATYPVEAPPESHLQEILASLPGAAVSEWIPKQHVTLTFETTDPREVAKAVDRILAKLFNPGDYSVDCTLQDL